MPVYIGDELYLTSPEAQLVMGVKAGLIAHYFYRNEFRGVIDMSDQKPLMQAIKAVGIEIDPVELEKFNKKSKSHFLVPMSSVLDKMMRRETRKITAKEKKLAATLKKQEKAKELQLVDEKIREAVLEQINNRREMEGVSNGN
jgi:peptidyl-tRNA hydrolase